jgi:4-diphosphocytidyl-2-C-methyl-D-erythritol kinase
VRITVPAPAKINLWLHIGERQPSGFHDLDTVFCALDLADTVIVQSAEPRTGISLEAEFAPPLETLPDLGPDAENLAVRAAAAFLDRAGMPADLRIRVVKRIPAGGGLGGGSSDAAAVLRGLARLHPGAVPPVGLHHLAADLGSDVPFFVAGRPAARGLGRGVDLLRVAAPPERPVLLVLPTLSILTADAYRWLAQERVGGLADRPPARAPLNLSDGLTWQQVQEHARNDFEPVIFHRFPEFQAIRDLMLQHAASPALLAGSGSTLFGVFEHDEAAGTAAEAVRAHDPAVRTLVTRTRSR